MSDVGVTCLLTKDISQPCGKSPVYGPSFFFFFNALSELFKLSGRKHVAEHDAKFPKLRRVGDGILAQGQHESCGGLRLISEPGPGIHAAARGDQYIYRR